jgi:hypothetical protein
MSTSPTTPSLLEGLIEPAPAAPAAPIARKRRRLTLPAPLRDRRVQAAIAAVLLIAGGVGAFLALRPVPQPDYATAPMDDVLGFTLLTDEFNKLPVDKRLDLISSLLKRLQSMSAEDSIAMSAFAAAIDSDKLREQLMKNASLIAIDKWDQYAKQYQAVPEAERGAFLEKTLIEFDKLGETLAGQPSNKTDQERLDEAREQARRDRDALTSGRGPTGGQLARMAGFMRNGMGQHSNPQQQIRGQQLMRDMTKHLRGD